MVWQCIPFLYNVGFKKWEVIYFCENYEKNFLQVSRKLWKVGNWHIGSWHADGEMQAKEMEMYNAGFGEIWVSIVLFFLFVKRMQIQMYAEEQFMGVHIC